MNLPLHPFEKGNNGIYRLILIYPLKNFKNDFL